MEELAFPSLQQCHNFGALKHNKYGHKTGKIIHKYSGLPSEKATNAESAVGFKHKNGNEQ